jgi:hypothetical protein
MNRHVTVKAHALALLQRFNPNHEPGGSPSGGQFSSGDGGGEGGVPSPQSTGHDEATKEKIAAEHFGINSQEFQTLSDYLDASRGKYSAMRNSPELQKVLEKLPQHEGTVYRGGTLPRTLLKDYTVGSVQTMELISSATSRYSKAEEFSAKIERTAATEKFLFHIEQKTQGHAIPKALEYYDESEVTLKAGGQYRVVSNVLAGEERHIVLREL